MHHLRIIERRRNGTGAASWSTIIFFAAIALAGVVVVSRLSAPTRAQGWPAELSATRDQAAASGKPVLLYFTADWCGPCQHMKQHVFPNGDVIAAIEDFVFVRIDIDRQPAVARHYGVGSIPQFAILNKEGTVVRSEVGAMQPNELVRWLKG